MKIQLDIFRGDQLVSRHLLDPGSYVLGRDADCQVCVDFPEVSRRHAQLELTADEVWISDLQSGNGVSLGGSRIDGKTRAVFPAEVRIGNIALRLDRAQCDMPRGASAPAIPSAPLERLKPRNYRVGGEIARGGMGRVLSAEDLNLRRVVAMKVIAAGPKASEISIRRFIQEAQVVAQLEHPNIVPLHELGVTPDGQLFFVMKMVKGRTLEQFLQELRERKPAALQLASLGSLLMIFQKVCDAVAFAHSKGVIHRDLKPANVMLGEYGEVLVMDWGLAKMLAQARHVAIGLDEDAGSNSISSAGTMDGQVLGTPQYMAPEQARGSLDEVDERTDIFALGAILYQMLTLRPPFESESVEDALEKARTGAVAAPGLDEVGWIGAKIPEALTSIAMKALSLDRAQRYESTQSLQQDLARFQNGFATAAERVSPWKVLKLAVRRRRTEFTLGALSLAALLIIAAVFVTKMGRTLAELRKAAPSFYAEAKGLIDERKLRPALEKINYAISLQPQRAEYHALKGNIFQTLLEWENAQAAYVEAIKRDVNLAAASENLLLSQKMRAATKARGEIAIDDLHSLRLAMLNQQRYAEAGLISERIGPAEAKFAEQWRVKIQKGGLDGVLMLGDGGSLSFAITNSPARDFSALQGVPLSELTLVLCTNISDLGFLRGMPLQRLILYECGIKEISVLRGMSLQFLSVDRNPFLDDLSPLRGMPLKVLNMGSTSVRDLSPLRGMPLSVVHLWFTPVEDLHPLAGIQIIYLALSHTRVSDLRPIATSGIIELHLSNCPNLRDLSPLTNCVGLGTLTIPPGATNISLLRSLPKIKRLDYVLPDFYGPHVKPVAQFWKEFDAAR